jgi:hypothetical protein
MSLDEELEKLEASVKKIFEDVDEIYKNYFKNIDKMSDYWANQFRLDSSDVVRTQKTLNQLRAIAAIGTYDNLKISYHRGIRSLRHIGSFEPHALESSGKKSAKIELFTGLDEYSENIPMEEGVV